MTPVQGILELHAKGYGFLRNPATNFTRERTDPFVPGTMVEKFGLREGLMLHGMVQRHRRGQGPRLKELLDVDGMPPDALVPNLPALVEIARDQRAPRRSSSFVMTTLCVRWRTRCWRPPYVRDCHREPVPSGQAWRSRQVR